MAPQGVVESLMQQNATPGGPLYAQNLRFKRGIDPGLEKDGWKWPRMEPQEAVLG